MIDHVIGEMISYFGRDVRRINHALKVHGFACAIACGTDMTDAEREALELAAVLHDIGIREAERKYNSDEAGLQEQEGPPVARSILERAGLDAALVDRVCFIVGNHHSYGRIDGVDFRALAEADLLVNIFEGDMGRTAVESAAAAVFRTERGTALLKSMYL